MYHSPSSYPRLILKPYEKLSKQVHQVAAQVYGRSLKLVRWNMYIYSVLTGTTRPSNYVE